MFVSVSNIAEVIIYNISHVSVFMVHPVFLLLSFASILFTLAMTRYQSRQKAAKIAREDHKRHNQIRRQMRHNELMHQMMQNQER
jgi:hypothetical protein